MNSILIQHNNELEVDGRSHTNEKLPYVSTVLRLSETIMDSGIFHRRFGQQRLLAKTFV